MKRSWLKIFEFHALRTHRAFGVLCLLWSIICSLPVLAQVRGHDPILLEKIVAIVDEEMILQSDLDQAVELYQLDRQIAGLQPEGMTGDLRGRVLDSLIENKLIIAAAKQSEMVVEDDVIEARVQDRVDQLISQFGSLEALQQALAASNLTLDDFRHRYGSQLRNQHYMQLVVGRFIRPGIEVMANEVEAYYLEHLDEMPAEPDSLVLANILVRIKPSAEERNAVQSKVAAAQQALAAGRSFAEVARSLSEGPNASRGGRIGAVRSGDLFDQSLEQALQQLGVGEVSPPVVSSRGVHLLRLDAIEPDGARVISQIFYPLNITSDDVASARRRLESARDRILAGEAFDLVAAEMSDDPSAASGGRLGTFQLDELAPAIQEVLAGVRAGQISEPLQTADGWYIFKVLDRIEGHRYTFDELKEELHRYVESQKIEAALEDYIQDLKGRFFVDIKE